MTRANKDLPDRLAALIRGTSTNWVMEQQPADWKHSAWKAQWERYPLPCPHVLAELAAEVHAHERIRRKFIFDAYRDRTPTELFIAVMAWGLGLSNYGPSRARRMLLQPNAGKAIEAVVNAVRQGGAAAGYSTYYSEGNTLDGLSVSFITKLIHFAGYESEHRPRPLIYDNLVATAITRLPTAPLLPGTEDLTHRRVQAVLPVGPGHGDRARNRTCRGRVGALRPRNRDTGRAPGRACPSTQRR